MNIPKEWPQSVCDFLAGLLAAGGSGCGAEGHKPSDVLPCCPGAPHKALGTGWGRHRRMFSPGTAAFTDTLMILCFVKGSVKSTLVCPLKLLFVCGL